MLTRGGRSSCGELELPRHPRPLPLARRCSFPHSRLYTTNEFLPGDLTNELMKQVQETLNSDHIDTHPYTAERFRHFLPNDGHNDEQLAIFRRWIDEPMFVTDDDLRRIIRCELSTASSPKLRSSSTCYFRSHELDAKELLTVSRLYASSRNTRKKAPELEAGAIRETTWGQFEGNVALRRSGLRP